ncbi:hypothetical protein HYW87_04580 [Candidatus Roizmanbacteria bacterium]|nr:hypothetical protein [Candidatus Roizmanbacteria bacterium]
MSWKVFFFVIFFTALIIFIPIFILMYSQYISLARPAKANLVIDAGKLVGTIPTRWKALAQGGEEKGVRMLGNVIPQIAQLYPRYIRIDHIYDYYDVVKRDQNGSLAFFWDKLDETVCDIYHTGAKPFFVLGYMPQALSGDETLVSKPKDWNEWAFLVQKTVERYSGKDTRLCNGQIRDFWLIDIYYEVWNEPDLETFGKWSIHGGDKDYKLLYSYSSLGAKSAQNVNHFFLGGPTTTALYRNWITVFLAYVIENNLRLDFISWHHYSKNSDDFVDDMSNINSFLAEERFLPYQSRPKIISEWGFDSNPNPTADSNVGAAYTVASIRNFIDQQFELAVLFEVKDGPSPRWGILSYEGNKKPRFQALSLLNQLKGYRLFVDGEGTYVTALASYLNGAITLVLVNYDPRELNNELVPIQFISLQSGTYSMTTTYLDGRTSKEDGIPVVGGKLQTQVILSTNTVVSIVLQKQ